MVSAFITSYSAAELFRYKSDYAGYKLYDSVSSTNFWKYADLIFEWGWFTIGSLAFFTQLLSLFGLSSGINLMVWHFGVGMVGMLVVQLSSALKWWAYDSAWAIANDDT